MGLCGELLSHGPDRSLDGIILYGVSRARYRKRGGSDVPSAASEHSYAGDDGRRRVDRPWRGCARRGWPDHEDREGDSVENRAGPSPPRRHELRRLSRLRQLPPPSLPDAHAQYPEGPERKAVRLVDRALRSLARAERGGGGGRHAGRCGRAPAHGLHHDHGSLLRFSEEGVARTAGRGDRDGEGIGNSFPPDARKHEPREIEGRPAAG